jgi:xanthine dehydrogenase accessory factor
MTGELSAWGVSEAKILSSIRTLLNEDREAALATVVDVDGNAYRRPGAKMVITKDGTGVGSITAGCLEDEMIQIAGEVIDEGQARLETYDLMEDDDVWGLGVGCNGIIDVLLEPIDESHQPLIDAYEHGQEIAAVTALASEYTDVPRVCRTYVQPSIGIVDGDEGFPAKVLDQLTELTASLVDQGKAATVEVQHEGNATEVFVDGITAPPELVIFGTGHDVAPLAELASKNEFQVTVIGFRGANVSDERFPTADTVLSTSPANIQKTHDFDKDTYAVVMTHNFVDDRIVIEELVSTSIPYIGLMGPRKRFEEMLEEYDKDQPFTEDELARIYTPIGLDLGGGSPYQIAHSIVAEVLAVHNNRVPRHLKERSGPIHDRIEVPTSNGDSRD